MLLPRTRLGQKRLYYFKKERNPSCSSYVFEQLFVYSGSIYLENSIELSNYLFFLGYCPNPRTNFERKCYEDEKIEKNGYVPFEHRSLVFSNQNQSLISNFTNDPQILVKKLAFIRNFNFVPESSHHLIIFNECKKPDVEQAVQKSKSKKEEKKRINYFF